MSLHEKTHLRTHHLMTWQDKRIIHMHDAFYCDMTHVYEYKRHDTTYAMTRDLFTCVILLSAACLLHVHTHLMTHIMKWQDDCGWLWCESFTCAILSSATWLIHTNIHYVTHLMTGYQAWLIHMCDAWLIHMCDTPWCDMTYEYKYTPWWYAMAHSYV